MKPALLLLPGMLCDGAFWRAQTDGLADICDPRVMAYGLADSIPAMAECVLAEAPETFAVAGHSMGGRVALEIVRQAPERVERLALIGTDYRGHDCAASRATETLNRDRLLAHAREHGMASLARVWFTGLVAPAQARDRALMDALVAMGARHSLRQLEAEIAAGLTRPDYAALLPSIACPTLVCAGEVDWLRSADNHSRMAAAIAQARFVMIPGAGHMIAMERPNALTAAMRAWMGYV
jgi:pimeloyl-ACP methyl ester carboxylesterase